MKTKGRSRKGGAASSLEGQLLIAMPAMADKRFARSVIERLEVEATGRPSHPRRVVTKDSDSLASQPPGVPTEDETLDPCALRA